MGGYLEIDGLKTWYEEQGAGEPLVLLHEAWRRTRLGRPSSRISPNTSESSHPSAAVTVTRPTSRDPSRMTRWQRTPSRS